MGRQVSVSKQRQAIKRFLATGNHDVMNFDWPGDWITSAKAADHAMKEALIAEVKRRAAGLAVPQAPVMDLCAFTRNKVAPMVNGLFPAQERNQVLAMLEKSVVFLTNDNIEEVLWHTTWLSTAWTLANLYLLSIGAELLSKSAPRIVGLSEGTTCYVSHEYFVDPGHYTDFVVHEAAHAFHNCKRSQVGLPETRTREFLLNIEFCQTETFAYACETYSRVLELANTRNERLKLLTELKEEFQSPDDKLDLEKFHTALAAAVAARNGWTKILQVCASVKRKVNHLQGAFVGQGAEELCQAQN